MDHTLEFDISGTIFKTKRSTLTAIKGTYLSNLDDSKQKYFFDKDPVLFRHILNAHREGVIHVPRDVCPSLFKKEILFWKLPLTIVAPCCWKYLYETESDEETYKVLLENGNRYDLHNKIDPTEANIKQAIFPKENKTGMEDANGLYNIKSNGNNGQTIASKIWLLLDEPGSSTAAKVWCFFYIFVVAVSVIIYMIWLEPSVRDSLYLNKDDDDIDVFADPEVYDYLVYNLNKKITLLIFTDPNKALLCLDIFCMIFFILETIIHFLVCPNKCRYFFSMYHLLKIFLCISMVISTVFEFRKDVLVDHEEIGEMYHAFKSFCALRLLLIFRLHKIYDGLHILLLSLRNSVKELLLLLFSFLIAVIVYGCLIFTAEMESKMFASPQIAMWWSLITMTTIGYGDFHPTTTLGYIVGVICAINGIIVLALPIAAVASTFSNLYSRNAELKLHLAEVRKQNQSTKSDDEKHSNTNDVETVSSL